MINHKPPDLGTQAGLHEPGERADRLHYARTRAAILAPRISETAEGAYIAFSSFRPENRQGIEDALCTVVEPPRDYEGEKRAMQPAVMNYFDLTQRAKDMVRKQVEWKLAREVA